MMGDYNANLKLGTNTLFGDELKRFCNEELLTISDSIFCDPNSFTFYSDAHESVSWLDHCVCNGNLQSNVKDVHVSYDFTTSDHFPMHATFEFHQSRVNTGEENENPPVRKIKWQTLSSDDLSSYRDFTETHLNAIQMDPILLSCKDSDCDDSTHHEALDLMYNSIMNSLRQSSDTFVQQTARKKKHVIPGWNEYCRTVHTDAREAFLLWVSNGRPRTGPILRQMQVTRAAFKQSLRRCKASTSRTHADNLARKLLMKDSRSFWAEVKLLSGKSNTAVASTIGTTTGSQAIANLWRSHYSSILNSPHHSDASHTVRSMLARCNSFTDPFSIKEVSHVLKELKLNKATGLDLLSAEHFRYACAKLSSFLCTCFNSMLTHNYVPKSFSDTVLVPIIKDPKSSVTDINNYRPIAITSVASKIFEKLMLSRLQEYLHTSDNQFSFKAKLASDMCIFTLKNIIEYYVTSSSPVYVCYLDASKAFDRVNYWLLFKKLVKRNVPTIFIRFLMSWYCSQEFVVRWGQTFSSPFSATNGVRQGGILSPLLFNVYLDDLSLVLKSTNVGCFLNGVSFNHLLYADDMTLIAPSIHSLQILLDHCDSFALANDIKFNANKTKCMCIRPKKFKTDFEPYFTLSSKCLDVVSSHKYLGVHITDCLEDDANIRYQCRNLYSRGNTIIRNFKNCNDVVKCSLFKTFCTQIYGAQTWSTFRCESFHQIKVAYNRIFRILMGLEHRVSMKHVLVCKGLDPFDVVFRKACVSFRSRLFLSDNTLIKTITQSRYLTSCKLYKIWNKHVFTFTN